jgi:translation initiation factor IF-1
MRHFHLPTRVTLGTVFLGFLALMGQAAGQGGGPAGVDSGSRVVKGSVLDQEGDYYVVKEMSGHEVRVHVSKETKMEDRIKVGDKVEAQVTADGHAQSIRVQLPEAPSTPPNPTGGISLP